MQDSRKVSLCRALGLGHPRSAWRAGLVALALAAMNPAPAQSDDKSCQAVRAKTAACASHETYKACEAVLKQAPECQAVEGLSSWLCMREIGGLVQRYFACKNRPESSPACPDLVDKVDKHGNKLEVLIGCTL